MVKLKDSLWVSAEQIAKIEVIEYHRGVHVTLTDGRVHTVPADYGKNAYDTAERLVSAVDAEMCPPPTSSNIPGIDWPL
jgi:hypothetical protein